MVDGGAGVPRYVFPTGSAFGPGGFIEFVAQPQLTLASPFDAYVLTVDQHRAVPAAALGGGGGDLAVTEADRHLPSRPEVQLLVAQRRPLVRPGCWRGASRPPSPVPSISPTSSDGPVELDLKAWGYGDWPGTNPPDHHVVVSLNGTEIGDGVFDGITAWERSLDVTSLVQETGNVLEVRVPGDTAYQFDYLAFEGFSVRYPRETVAIAGALWRRRRRRRLRDRRVRGGQAVAIWLFDGSYVAARRADGNGRPSAASPGTAQVWAAAQPALVKPGISAGVPEAQPSSKAEYLIVTHPPFTGSLGDLVALEEGRGFTTEVVTVDRIYAAYSDHAPSADAIKRFLTTSWEKGKLQVRAAGRRRHHRPLRPPRRSARCRTCRPPTCRWCRTRLLAHRRGAGRRRRRLASARCRSAACRCAPRPSCRRSWPS